MLSSFFFALLSIIQCLVVHFFLTQRTLYGSELCLLSTSFPCNLLQYQTQLYRHVFVCWFRTSSWRSRRGIQRRSNHFRHRSIEEKRGIIDIGSSIKSCPIKLKTKCKKKWRWSCRLMKTWHTYNNNIVNLFAKKLIQNLHFYSRYGIFYV